LYAKVEKMKQIHFIAFEAEDKTYFAGGVACGLVVYIEDEKFLTSDPEKVTCKNCKKTKFMKTRIRK